MFDEKVGEAFITFTMPRSIRTLELRGVSMSGVYGLGTTEKPAEIKVGFYLDLSLPYNCRRGETVPLNINIFSHLSRNQSVTVTVARSESDFTILNPTNDKWTSKLCQKCQIEMINYLIIQNS